MPNLYHLIVTLCILLSLNTSIAKPLVIPKAPLIAAKSFILVDFDSGKILAEKNANVEEEPASLTKLMTAYAIFHELKQGNIKLSDKATVSKNAWKTPGSRMFIEVNSQVTIENLLKGMIIQSGNDASVALAEYVAGSEDSFAALMNQHASELGMSNTNFLNSTGLPHPNHHSTAKDLAKLAAALIRKFPEYYKWYSVKEFKYNNIQQYNRNKLLRLDKSVDGMKTGYTKSAGYCLVSSAKRKNMRLITIVLGTNSTSARAQESQKLLNFGFRFYETHEMFAANKSLKQLKVYKGNKNNLAVGIPYPLFVTIPRGEYKNLKPLINLNEFIQAPVKKGQKFGEVLVSLNNKLIVKTPIIALESIAEGNLWQRLKDSAILMLK